MHRIVSAVPLVGALALGLLTTGAMTGCYSEVESPQAAQPADEVPAEETQTSERDPDDAYEARSTLGKAKQTAQRTVDKLEERDRELQKQIDDQ